ncbi:hypothetical protein ALP34_200134 [Pseudomonas savastanoi pv. glycinea]|nr:hypothetical protein ALP34_200134 [Pseudomonas savastanoi pv. glycinea]
MPSISIRYSKMAANTLAALLYHSWFLGLSDTNSTPASVRICPKRYSGSRLSALSGFQRCVSRSSGEKR